MPTGGKRKKYDLEFLNDKTTNFTSSRTHSVSPRPPPQTRLRVVSFFFFFFFFFPFGAVFRSGSLVAFGGSSDDRDDDDDDDDDDYCDIVIRYRYQCLDLISDITIPINDAFF